MHRIGKLAFLTIAAAAVTTVGFVNAMQPSSGIAFLAFSAWLVSPYVVMAAALALRRRSPSGDLIFWHTDAQWALAVLMAPLFQGVALVLLLALARVVSPASPPPPGPT